MKTIKYSILFLTICLFGIFASCDDYLDFDRPGGVLIDDSFIDSIAATSFVTGCYAPLAWEYQNNGGTFFNEWWIGDVCSDDALKGGSNLSDMNLVYDMENFKTKSDNNVLLWYYRCQYIGIFRCNLVFDNVPNMDPKLLGNGNLQNRLIGEASFLRALYYMRLVRVFGGIPVVDQVTKSQDDWKQPRGTENDVYNLIYADLQKAIRFLPEKSGYRANDLGRATKGAARALLMKAYMNNEMFNEAKLQGDSIIASGQYRLVTNFYDIFTVEGENGPESIFEIQNISESTSDAWGGMGFSRGTLTPTMTRPRWASEEGWGFNRPSQELFDEFESGDPRRDATIYNPTYDQVEPSDDNTNNINVYLGNRYTSRKYVMMNPDTTWIKLGHSTRGEINKKEIRYADVLLMYAEACCKGTTQKNISLAKWALEEVRKRARGSLDVLPSFPNYKNYQDSETDLFKAIQHERRVELAMEGHRWFDLKRWGILAETMNSYRVTTKPQISEHMSEFVRGKHELFPIPLQERDLNSPMPQNPGYDGVPIQ